MARTFGRRQPLGGSPAVGANSPTSSPAPELARHWLRFAAQLAAAALVGFGLILWIAANWDGISRAGRFGLVGGAVAAAVALALVARLRTPALLAAFLAAGGLLALIGQTYQSGADSWQLFALWAALTLPWALAARHDALWAPWGAVVVTAIALWQLTFAPGLWLPVDPSPALAAWAMGLGVAFLLSPWSPLRPWTGASRWAFRLVMVLAIALVAHSAIGAALGTRSLGALYVSGLLALAGVGAAIALLSPFDLALLAVVGLGLDAALISGAWRLLLEGARDFTGPMLMIGLVSAAIVAGTGTLLLAIARERSASLAPAGLLGKGSTWPATLLTGVGALLAAIPLLAFLGLLLGVFLTNGPGPYVIGALVLLAASALLRTQPQASFLHQLAVIGLALGFLLLGFGLYRDAGTVRAAASLTLALIAVGMAFVVGRTWALALLGAIAALLTADCLGELLATGRSRLPLSPSAGAWTMIAAAGGGWYILRLEIERDVQGSEAGRELLARADRFVGGWTAMALLGLVLAAGPTFLLGASLGWRATGHAVSAADGWWSSLSPLSALAALAGAALVLARRPSLGSPLGGGAALVAVVLSAVIAQLGAAILLLCVALLADRRTLGVAAALTALWAIGSFYYWLGWPLADKAALLIAAGVALGASCLMAGLSRPPISRPAHEPASASLAAGLVAAGALAVSAFAGEIIRSNEEIIASGRPVYLALAPVDPRSLMQGDYMALNFALPADGLTRRAETPGGRLWAVASLDDRRVASITRVERERPTARPDEVVFELKARAGRWIVGTDAWYFKEGTAARWARARFGEFRVAPSGAALLVALADKDLEALR